MLVFPTRRPGRSSNPPTLALNTGNIPHEYIFKGLTAVSRGQVCREPLPLRVRREAYSRSQIIFFTDSISLSSFSSALYTPALHTPFSLAFSHPWSRRGRAGKLRAALSTSSHSRRGKGPAPTRRGFVRYCRVARVARVKYALSPSLLSPLALLSSPSHQRYQPPQSHPL